MGIYDEDNLILEGDISGDLLIETSNVLSIFSAVAVRDFRQFPDDGQRRWPVPIDLVRKWPSI